MSAIYSCQCCPHWVLPWKLREQLEALGATEPRVDARAAEEARVCAECWWGDPDEPTQKEMEADWNRDRNREIAASIVAPPAPWKS